MSAAHEAPRACPLGDRSRPGGVIELLAVVLLVSSVSVPGVSAADPETGRDPGNEDAEEILEGPFEGVVPTDAGYETPSLDDGRFATEKPDLGRRTSAEDRSLGSGTWTGGGVLARWPSASAL